MEDREANRSERERGVADEPVATAVDDAPVGAVLTPEPKPAPFERDLPIHPDAFA